ncbi:MAG: hypothetical protein ABJA66_07815 [Actinomycetota bacterium]
MKKCMQCEQVYGDETNFCLSDGASLVSVSGSFTSHTETPTVMSNFPFIPPLSSAPPETKKSNTLLIVAGVGLLLLVAGGAIAGLVIYNLSKSSAVKNENIANISNSTDKSNKNGVAEQKSGNDNLAQNLKEQQDNLKKDKQKLEDERKALEAKKKDAAQTPKPADSRPATIIDPPSNVRQSPNGAVLCIIKQRTIINITGTTNVYDNNGVWYYTDVCGKTGVIHSSQIKF